MCAKRSKLWEYFSFSDDTCAEQSFKDKCILLKIENNKKNQ